MRYNYSGYSRCACVCNVEIYKGPERALVIMTELPENTGTSVTNISEQLATELRAKFLAGYPPMRIIWIEHYPKQAGAGGESFDSVHYSWNAKQEYIEPTWRHLTKRAVQELKVGMELVTA
jgi:hypothetical protein